MKPLIRVAKPGDEKGLHESHMRSIREVCVKEHGEEEVRGWGNRPQGDRWVQAIQEGHVWAVEFNGSIHGSAYIKLFETEGVKVAYIHGLYLTPEIIGKGLGKKLTSLMLEKARAFGAPSVLLESSLTAHEFYKKMGFKDTGPRGRTEIGGSPVSFYPMEILLL